MNNQPIFPNRCQKKRGEGRENAIALGFLVDVTVHKLFRMGLGEAKSIFLSALFRNRRHNFLDFRNKSQSNADFENRIIFERVASS